MKTQIGKTHFRTFSLVCLGELIHQNCEAPRSVRMLPICSRQRTNCKTERRTRTCRILHVKESTCNVQTLAYTL